ncbi:MAG: 50S ribosomal protein L10, partial [Candidatus Andersenbacteria bacterium]|nr:50S ribosomal protein L10 [Candidatus Andersenbacteria bacterium]
MPLTRQQKEMRVQDTQQDLAAAVSIVFTTFDGLTVAEMTDLRTQLAEAGGGLRVLPKRLLQIVLKNLALDLKPRATAGQLAVAWGSDDIAPARTLNVFAKAHAGKLQLLAGVLTGQILSLEEVTTLAALPSREQMLSQLLNVMNGSARSLAAVLAAVPGDFVRTLHAIASLKSP